GRGGGDGDRNRATGSARQRSAGQTDAVPACAGAHAAAARVGDRRRQRTRVGETARVGVGECDPRQRIARVRIGNGEGKQRLPVRQDQIGAERLGDRGGNDGRERRRRRAAAARVGPTFGR